MKNKKTVLFLVEKGWQGTREFSIELSKQGIESLCLVKGVLNKEILDMITSWPGVKIASVRRRFFKLYTVFKLLFFKNSFIAVVADSEKSYKAISGWRGVLGKKVFKLLEQGNTCALFLDGGKLTYAEAAEKIRTNRNGFTE